MTLAGFDGFKIERSEWSPTGHGREKRDLVLRSLLATGEKRVETQGCFRRFL
jgi:hypothetical protein